MVMNNPSGLRLSGEFSTENINLKKQNEWACCNCTLIHFNCLTNYTNQSAKILFFLPSNKAQENAGLR